MDDDPAGEDLSSEQRDTDRAAERALVEACASGDAGAWSRLVRDYGRLVLHVARRSLRARGYAEEDVEDVVHDTFAELLKDDARVLRSFRGECRLSTWLAVIAERRVSRVTRRKRLRAVPIDAAPEDEVVAAGAAAEDDAADAALPAAPSALWQAVTDLPERDRALLTLYYQEKKKHKEIAERLGLATGSVGQLLFRARERLRRKLVALRGS
jgi:RNA polymerase sigma-70 factor (ECF subfamily)